MSYTALDRDVTKLTEFPPLSKENSLFSRNTNADDGGGGSNNSSRHNSSTPRSKKSLIPKEFWMSDVNAKKCYECEKEFTAFRRKHHCRLCGQVFCNSCSSHRISGDPYNHDGMIRVCNHCSIMAQRESKEAASLSPQHTPTNEDAGLNPFRRDGDQDSSAMMEKVESNQAEESSVSQDIGVDDEEGEDNEEEEEEEEVEPILFPETTTPLADDKNTAHRLQQAADLHLEFVISRLVALFELESHWKDRILQFASRAANELRIKQQYGDGIDIHRFVKVKTLPGGKPSHSKYIDGVVFRKNLAHKRMRTSIQNPRILMLNCALDFHRKEFTLSSLDTLVMQEKEHMKMMVQKIKSLQPDLVIISKGASRLAQEMLKKEKISLIINVKQDLMRRIARATQAHVLAAPEFADKTVLPRSRILGTCEWFRLSVFREDDTKRARPVSNVLPHEGAKTLLFFQGCNPTKHATVYIRGDTEERLKIVKKVLMWAFQVARSLRLETAFLRVSGGSYTEEALTRLRNYHKEMLALPLDSFSSSSSSSSSIPTSYSNNALHTSASVTSIPPEASPHMLSETRDINHKLRFVVPNDPTQYPPELNNRPYVLKKHRLLREEERSSERKYYQLRLVEPDAGLMFQPLSSSPFIDPPARPVSQYISLKDFVKDEGEPKEEAKREGIQPVIEEEEAKSVASLPKTETKTKGPRVPLHIDTSSSSPSRNRPKSSSSSTSVRNRKQRAKKTYTSKQLSAIKHQLPWISDELSATVCFYTKARTKHAVYHCIKPTLMSMKQYCDSQVKSGGIETDMTLGDFLKSHCFNLSRLCQSPDCKKNTLRHTLSFSYGAGRVKVVTKRWNPRIPQPTEEESISMWSMCKGCGRKAGYAVLDDDTKNLSFAKFIELCFGNRTAMSADPECTHTVCDHHVRFFAQQPIFVSIEYQKVTPYETFVESRMSYEMDAVNELRHNSIKEVLSLSLSVCQQFLFKLADIESEWGSVTHIDQKLTALNSEVRAAREEYAEIRKKLVDHSELSPPDVFTTNAVKDMLKRHFCNWNEQLQTIDNDVALLEKNRLRAERKALMEKSRKSANDPTPPSTPPLSPSMTGAPAPEQSAPVPVGSMSPSKNSGKIYSPHRRAKDAAATTTPSSTSASSSHLKKPLGENSTSEADMNIPTSISPSVAEEKSPLLDPVSPRTAMSSALADDGNNNSSAVVDGASIPRLHAANHAKHSGLVTVEELVTRFDLNERSLEFLDTSSGMHLGVPQTIDSMVSVSDRELSSVIAYALVSSDHKSFLSEDSETERSSTSTTRTSADGTPTSISTPASAIAPPLQHVTQQESVGEASREYLPLFVDSQPNSPAPNRFNIRTTSSRAAFNDGSPSLSRAASGEFDAASSPPVSQFSALKGIVRMGRRQSGITIASTVDSKIPNTEPHRVNSLVFDEMDDDSSPMSEAAIEETMKSQDKIPFKLDFEELDPSPFGPLKGPPAQFSVTAFFPKQFYAFRQHYCCSEKQFIQSLSQSREWDASGGKSGSTFSQTLDGRYILKYVKWGEMKMFLDTAHSYFDYMCLNVFHKRVPSMLVRILGVYQITIRRKGGRTRERNVIVMPNAFYGRNIDRVFDLKGSIRNRHVDTEKASKDSVLLDVNFMEFTKGFPLHLREQSKKLLSMATNNDTLFLSRISVVDYSLLIGIDEKERELVVGIIDYVHQYTLTKVLEKNLKELASKESATVQSPDVYKKRFREAMDRYFIGAATGETDRPRHSPNVKRDQIIRFLMR